MAEVFYYVLAGFLLDYLATIWTFAMGLGMIYISRKKSNVVAREFNLGLGLFFISSSFSVFLYLLDLTRREFWDGQRIFPAEAQYEEMGYVFDSFNIQFYFIIQFIGIFIALGFLLLPIEKYIFNRKPLFSKIAFALSPIPPIIRSLELLTLPQYGTPLYYVYTSIYLTLWIIIGLSILTLIFIYAKLMIKSTGEMRYKSGSIVVALILWVITFFMRSTFLKQIKSNVYSFWVLPAMEMLALYLFIYGYQNNLELENEFSLASHQKYLYEHWLFKAAIVGIITYIAVYFSIIFWNQDLLFTQYWHSRALSDPKLAEFGDIAARSMFEGEGFGLQDISYLIIFISLILYILSFIPALEPKLGKYRMYFGFIVASAIALGIMNRWFKVFFARVRPGDANQFNPEYNAVLYYTPMWTFGYYDLSDALSRGSFTSGHTTTAAITIALAFISIRTHKTWVITLSFAATLTFSILMAFGRVVEGAHYPGDTLWAIITSLIMLTWLYFDVFKIPKQEEGELTITNKFAELKWAIEFVFFGVFFTIATLGIKYSILEFEWYWPLAAIIGGVLSWVMWKIMPKTLYGNKK